MVRWGQHQVLNLWVAAKWTVGIAAPGLGIALLLLSVVVRADDKTPKAASLFTYPRGGPERTGAYPETQMPDRPATVWIDALGSNTGTPVVTGDRMIVGNRSGDLLALSLKDGAVVWTVAEVGWDVMVAPVVVGDRIYCASNRGLTAHSLTDGSVVWRKDIQGGSTESSPLVVGELVVVGGADGFVYALDARSGKERWKADVVTGAPADPEGFPGARARGGNNAARPGMAASDGMHVFISMFDQSRVLALDLKTGEARWSFQAKGWIAGGPTVGEGKVFFGSQDHKIYALEAGTGKVAWAFATKWRADGGLAYCDGSVFASASDGRCYRLDAQTGRKVWEYETEVGPDQKHYFLSPAPLIDATAVYFGSWDGYLYALKRKDGTLKWRHRPHDNDEHVGAPITDGNRLYVPLTPLFDFENQRDKKGVHGIAAIGSAQEVAPDAPMP
ncbi:PQQ-binding-like beta-propeller repeat protein [Singulisphaera sp. Ch08]|uniref:PQQ-binding-like beta-propeller repeat protein n=1 Tax=Singulisphaera sp. Ch08 TaxID=3120278 RepID=A0AAU7C9U4_9BACT